MQPSMGSQKIGGNYMRELQIPLLEQTEEEIKKQKQTNKEKHKQKKTQ